MMKPSSVFHCTLRNMKLGEVSLYMKLFHLSLVSVSFRFRFYSLLCYGENMSEAGFMKVRTGITIKTQNFTESIRVSSDKLQPNKTMLKIMIFVFMINVFISIFNNPGYQIIFLSWSLSSGPPSLSLSFLPVSVSMCGHVLLTCLRCGSSSLSRPPVKPSHVEDWLSCSSARGGRGRMIEWEAVQQAASWFLKAVFGTIWIEIGSERRAVVWSTVGKKKGGAKERFFEGTAL